MARHGPYYNEENAKQDAAGYRALGYTATVKRQRNLSTGQRIFMLYVYRKK